MWFRRIAGLAALCVVGACSAPMHGVYIPLTHYTAYTPARPLIAENRVDPYDGQLPACGDPGVLGFIKDRFASREGGYWDSAAQDLRFHRALRDRLSAARAGIHPAALLQRHGPVHR